MDRHRAALGFPELSTARISAIAASIRDDRWQAALSFLVNAVVRGYFFLQRIRQAMPDITESTDQQIRGLRSTRPSVANFRDNDNLHSDLTNRTNQSNIEDRTIIAPSRPCSL